MRRLTCAQAASLKRLMTLWLTGGVKPKLTDQEKNKDEVEESEDK